MLVYSISFENDDDHRYEWICVDFSQENLPKWHNKCVTAARHLLSVLYLFYTICMHFYYVAIAF